LEKAQHFYVGLIETETPTWSDIRRLGKPATVTLRKVYQGYVYLGNFYYMTDDVVHVVSLSSEKIRKAIEFGNHRNNIKEALNVIPLIGRSLKAFLTSKASVKAAALLYQEIASRNNNKKDPVQVASEVYGVSRSELEEFLKKNKIRESLVSGSGNSIAREITSMPSVISVEDVVRTPTGYVVTVTDTEYNHYEITIRPKLIINKNV
jgi:hypothetical protein